MSTHHYYWAFLERLAPLSISFIVSVIIARLVSPEAYGLVAMLGIFMALGQAFTELGFGAALVQRKNITPDDETSVFIINVAAGLLITVILCAASPFIARFFGHEILVPMLCVQSLGIFIASTGLVQFALISREMKFHLGAIIEMVATVVSGILGVSMAFWGYGVWSLVALGLSREIVRTVAVWMTFGWRPRGKFSKKQVLEMWRYCSRLLYASLLHRIATNLHTMIIAKIFAPVTLGIYARASGFQALPVGVITGIVQRVAFPQFSAHQDDKLFLLQSIRKQIRIIVLVVSLLMALLAVLAAELIPWLFGSQWNNAVPLFKILCIAGVLTPPFNLHCNMTMALGKSDIFFKIEFLKKLAIVVVLAVVYRFGIEGFAWGAVAIAFTDYCLSAFPSTRLLCYSWRMQLVDLIPALMLSSVSALIVFNIPWNVAWPVVTLMVLKAFTLLVLAGVGLTIFRKIYFYDTWDMLHGTFQPIIARLKQA